MSHPKVGIKITFLNQNHPSGNTEPAVFPSWRSQVGLDVRH